MSKAYADRLANALRGTGFVEPVDVRAVDNRINVLCRVNKDQEGPWIELLTRLLQSTEAHEKEAYAWQSHFCKHYFLKGEGAQRKMVFGWNISVQSGEMSIALDSLIRVIKGGPIKNPGVKGEVDEMPLLGAPSNRGARNALGKGASTVGGSDDFRPGR